jgi:DNA modification methylase
MTHRAAAGVVRDSIVAYLRAAQSASIAEIKQALAARIGDVAASSLRAYLNLNTPQLFERAARGHYKLRSGNAASNVAAAVTVGNAQLYHASCFDWMRQCEPRSVHAIVTDPPYGLLEYSAKEQAKLRNGRGGVWRIPPSFDGHQRAPLPRFTILSDGDRAALHDFFFEFGKLAVRVTVPGANVVVASNPLLVHVVAHAMVLAGLQMRGYLVRLVMTMRGGDRPKNAHREFPDISVMPRSMFEPWLILRRPLDGRVQDNLRSWQTGGFRRPSAERPFGDVIRSHPTPRAERAIAPHPSLKPQAFLRTVIRAVLPRAEGVVLDPFAGSGSTLAACNAVGYPSIGVECDVQYIRMARKAIPALSVSPGRTPRPAAKSQDSRRC